MCLCWPRQEQAADREHERDVFQQEIQNLEQQLKNPQKTQTGNERRDREVHDHMTSTHKIHLYSKNQTDLQLMMCVSVKTARIT